MYKKLDIFERGKLKEKQNKGDIEFDLEKIKKLCRACDSYIDIMKDRKQ